VTVAWNQRGVVSGGLGGGSDAGAEMFPLDARLATAGETAASARPALNDGEEGPRASLAAVHAHFGGKRSTLTCVPLTPACASLAAISAIRPW